MLGPVFFFSDKSFILAITLWMVWCSVALLNSICWIPCWSLGCGWDGREHHLTLPACPTCQWDKLQTAWLSPCVVGGDQTLRSAWVCPSSVVISFLLHSHGVVWFANNTAPHILLFYPGTAWRGCRHCHWPLAIDREVKGSLLRSPHCSTGPSLAVCKWLKRLLSM